MQQRLSALSAAATDAGELARQVSTQGDQTECSDPNETMGPDPWIGTNGLYNLKRPKEKGQRVGTRSYFKEAETQEGPKSHMEVRSDPRPARQGTVGCAGSPLGDPLPAGSPASLPRFS